MQDINKANQFMSTQYNVVDTEYYILFKEKKMEVLQKKLHNIISGLASCSLNSSQVSNDDLRMLLDNFFNGGIKTTFGKVTDIQTNRAIMKWKAIIGMIAVLSVLSCDRQKNATPEGLLSESQMIDIMTDVQIIEADINSRRAKGMNTDSLSVAFYDQLFEHYGITDSIFSFNLKYYTQNLATLENIMDSVTNRLLKAQMESRKDDSQ